MSSRVLVRCGRQLGLSQTSPWRLAVVLRDSTSPFLLRERSVLSRTQNFTFSRCITSSQSRCYNPQATTSGSETGQKNSEQTGPSSEAIRRAKLFQIATGAACAFFGASYILYRQLKLQASEIVASEVWPALEWFLLVVSSPAILSDTHTHASVHMHARTRTHAHTHTHTLEMVKAWE